MAKLRFSLPAWLFKPAKTNRYDSSTVAAFSPDVAISSSQGFQGRMLPGPEAADADKMTLLIHAPELRKEETCDPVRTALTVHRLIRLGFKVYIIMKGQAEQLMTTANLSEGDVLEQGVAADILIKATGILRDDLVICDFGKIKELSNQLFSVDDRVEDETLLRNTFIRYDSNSYFNIQSFNQLYLCEFNVENKDSQPPIWCQRIHKATFYKPKTDDSISWMADKINEMSQIQELAIIGDHHRQLMTIPNIKNDFKHLKALTVTNLAIEEHTLLSMINRAEGLISLDFSMDDNQTSGANFDILHRVAKDKESKGTFFDHVEELRLTGYRMRDTMLFTILKRMPKLRKLSLCSVLVHGDDDGDALNPNPIVDIEILNSEISTTTLKALFRGARPISIKINSKTELDFRFILRTVAHTAFRTDEVISLSAVNDSAADVADYLDMFPKLRSLTLHDTSHKSIEIDEANYAPYLYLDSVVLSAKHYTSDDLISLIKMAPNLKSLNVGDNSVLRRVLDFIHQSKHANKKILFDHLHTLYIAYLNKNNFDHTPVFLDPALISGQHSVASSGVVYDRILGYNQMWPDLRQALPNQIIKLEPMFEFKSGRDLNLQNIRLFSYHPDYRSDEKQVIKHPIVCDLKPYTIMPCLHSEPAVYEHPAYDARFEPADRTQGLPRPFIRLRSLTANDQLLALRTSLKPSDFTLYFSEPDGFYYLVLNDGVAAPATVTLSYELSAYKPSCHALPASVQEKRRPFARTYTSPADASYASKTLTEKLAEVYAHPEHHACGVRADAFIAQVQGEPDISVRAAGSGYHGWAEIKHQGVWHTVDLGGQDVAVEYLPEQEASTPAAALTAVPVADAHTLPMPSSTAAAAQAIIEKPKPQPEQALQGMLASKDKNANILVICKRDADKSQLKAVRRYIRSLLPDNTTVVDEYSKALSSVPYIHLDAAQVVWESVEPQGAQGWMKAQLEHSKRLLIDWSSLTASQSTKINAAIDISHRQLDGLSIDETVQVISLVYEDDPRLEDSSFMSRHQGCVVNFTRFKLESADLPVPSKTLPVELYHSTQWQRLLLGSLGFDEAGKPLHTHGDLLKADASYHLIINNPPKDCEAFERFIQDIEDGHSFKYQDQSIKLPRMKVTRTQGYNFAARTQALVSVHTEVRADDLSNIEIDHVLTPSTFERCLGTRRIVEGQLMATPGWLSSASQAQPLSLYITKTLSEQQYYFLLTTVPAASLRLYCAPGVVLPHELGSSVIARSTPRNDGGSAIRPASANTPSIFDISECSSDDVLYRHDYHREGSGFIFTETVSDIWRKLEAGEHVVLTGIFSDELIDHLATLLLPKPYLWHDGCKKTFPGTLTLKPGVPAIQHTHEPQTIASEAQRKPALMALLKAHPAVFIEGKPGIGKSCFIRELKADPGLQGYSFDAFDTKTLTDWAINPDESRPALLFIDEATIRGTDWSIFRGLYTPKREILIDGKVYALKPHHKVVFIGNRVKTMPALLNAAMPTLLFETLTKDYVIHTILKPIFAQVCHTEAEALKKATAHYDEKKSVREMQGEAIRLCARPLVPTAHPPKVDSSSRKPYFITMHRTPIFNAILESLAARRFMQNATADAAQYGGKTGHMLEGLPGLGKSDIIHAAMAHAGYTEITDLAQLHHDDITQERVYFRIPASTDIKLLRQHLKQAFLKGHIVMIDELDAMLRPDTPEREDEVSRVVAELNAYLMGEDLQHRRPPKAGFMLLATGNGITYAGRAALPESLKSRLHVSEVPVYTQAECEFIIQQKYPGLDARALIQTFVHAPKEYTFRQLLADCEKAAHDMPVVANNKPEADLPARPQQNPTTSTSTTTPIIYHFYNKRAFKISMPAVLVGITLGLALGCTGQGIPVSTSVAIASAMTTAFISAWATSGTQNQTVLGPSVATG